jgi:hypothetical protein
VFRASELSFEDHQKPRDFKRPHLIDLVISVGPQGLNMFWIYSRNLHRRETIATLADNFILHLRSFANAQSARTAPSQGA